MFTDIQDYAIVADLRVGSNSLGAGTPELSAGTAVDSASGQYAWDPNVNDGFDSGWVDVSLTVNAGGGTNGIVWQVGNTSVFYSGATYGEVFGFTLRAGVDGATGDLVSFRNIVGRFYYGSAWGETGEFDDVAASTVNVQATEDEAIVEMFPEGTGYTRAVFSAQVRLQAGAGLPDADELFGQVFVHAAGA